MNMCFKPLFDNSNKHVAICGSFQVEALALITSTPDAEKQLTQGMYEQNPSETPSVESDA